MSAVLRWFTHDTMGCDRINGESGDERDCEEDAIIECSQEKSASGSQLGGFRAMPISRGTGGCVRWRGRYMYERFLLKSENQTPARAIASVSGACNWTYVGTA